MALTGFACLLFSTGLGEFVLGCWASFGIPPCLDRDPGSFSATLAWSFQPLQARDARNESRESRASSG